jgi:hypothetical protein
VCLSKYDHVVETFPSDCADQSLHVLILPRRPRGNRLEVRGNLQRFWRWGRQEETWSLGPGFGRAIKVVAGARNHLNLLLSTIAFRSRK